MKLKKLCTFLMILLLVGLTSFSLLNGVLLSGCFKIIKEGTDDTQYFKTDVYSNTDLIALGKNDDGDFVAATGGLDGKHGKKYNLSRSPLPANIKPVGMFCVSASELILPAYLINSDGEYDSLVLYYINLAEKSCTPLTSFDCAGNTARERLESVRVSSLSAYNSKISFAVFIKGKCELYSADIAGKTVTQINSLDSKPMADALVLEDGSAVYANGNTLSFSGDREDCTVKGAVFTKLSQAKDGFYCFDSASGRLMFFSLEENKAKPFFAFAPSQSEDGEIYAGYPDALYRAVDSDARVLLLKESGDFALVADGAQQIINTAVYRSKGQCTAIIVVLALAVIIASYAIYYVIAEVRKLKMPLVLRKGLTLAAILIIGVNAVVSYALVPIYDAQAGDYARSTLGAAAVLAAESKSAENMLSSVRETLGSAELCVLKESGGSFAVEKVSTGAFEVGKTGLDPAVNVMFGEGFAQAKKNGSAFTYGYFEGTPVYKSFFSGPDGRVTVVLSHAGNAVRDAQKSLGTLTDALFCSAAVIWMIVILMLSGVVTGILRVSKGMDYLAASGFNVEVVQRSGDELEGLARSFNDMAKQVRKTVDMTSNRNNSYLRFVPQQIITLLGKTSVEDVDKQTFISRKMATMMVWFGFGEDVYESRTKELFDNINRVIEKTAAIVSQNGGTVYNFTYNGYDAVFADDPELAVSTAVAIRQEVTSLNRERAKNGESLVAFRIALDDGDVMMGIVGDENRMVPTAISASLNTAKRLVSLCSKLDANILCTESVAAIAKDYNSRYVGKSRDGENMIRVYEIFDGDNYNVRLAKEASVQRFSEGILTFYSRDFSAAKRIFIDIARQNSDDGAAKFYLYLSDKFERELPDDISLDY